MRISKNMVVAAVAALALAGASGVAFASHGKAGLWSVNMSIAGQDTSKMPPNVLDRMKSMGMMPNSNGGFTVQHCMTAAEVADDSKMMDTSSNKDCEVANRRVTGHAMTADLICKGQMTGTGHVSVNYDSDTHYTGEMSISGKTADGTPISQEQRFEGHWVSASCGSVSH